jgi:hypothetical protein
MSVTCKFSKRKMFIPGKVTWSAEEWGNALVDGLLAADWGIPCRIILDRDRKFLSAVWKTIFSRLNMKLLFSLSYHPQTDGQSERTNQSAEICLRYLIGALDDPKQWPVILPFL